jgi:hypothetical protein
LTGGIPLERPKKREIELVFIEEKVRTRTEERGTYNL